MVLVQHGKQPCTLSLRIRWQPAMTLMTKAHKSFEMAHVQSGKAVREEILGPKDTSFGALCAPLPPACLIDPVHWPCMPHVVVALEAMTFALAVERS